MQSIQARTISFPKTCSLLHTTTFYHTSININRRPIRVCFLFDPPVTLHSHKGQSNTKHLALVQKQSYYNFSFWATMLQLRTVNAFNKSTKQQGNSNVISLWSLNTWITLLGDALIGSYHEETKYLPALRF
jgi:hypothetical protein